MRSNLLFVALTITSPLLAIVNYSKVIGSESFEPDFIEKKHPLRAFYLKLGEKTRLGAAHAEAAGSMMQVCPKLAITNAHVVFDLVNKQLEFMNENAYTRYPLLKKHEFEPTKGTTWFVFACKFLTGCQQWAGSGKKFPGASWGLVTRVSVHPDYPITRQKEDASLVGNSAHDLAAAFTTSTSSQDFIVKLPSDEMKQGTTFLLAGAGPVGAFSDRLDGKAKAGGKEIAIRSIRYEKDEQTDESAASTFGEIRFDSIKFDEMSLPLMAIQTFQDSRGTKHQLPISLSHLSLPAHKPQASAVRGDSGGMLYTQDGDIFTVYGTIAMSFSEDFERNDVYSVGVAYASWLDKKNREQLIRWMKEKDSGCTPKMIEAIERK